jgi:hypothetical protein
MTKKDFIALADMIREHNKAYKDSARVDVQFGPHQINCLANFCSLQNPAFMRERWLGYIAGTNGKNGGKVA